MIQRDAHVCLWREMLHDAHIRRWRLHYPPPPKVTPEIIEGAFGQEYWNLTQLTAWFGTRNPEDIAIGSESFSPWRTFRIDSEAEYALLARRAGELDAPPGVEAQNDAHVRRWGRALAEKDWKRWGEEVESTLRAGLLGLAVILVDENGMVIPDENGKAIRTISVLECTNLKLITARFLAIPRLIWRDAARGSGKITSPLVRRDLVLKAFPAREQHDSHVQQWRRTSPSLTTTPPLAAQLPVGYNDSVHFPAIFELLNSGQVRSTNEAVRLIVEREGALIPGASDAAKIDRIARKFQRMGTLSRTVPK